ncbi:MAG: hypothetical protein IT208_14825 [Chthonomonadales bacterium]|nr:hypothetical protein [Chthonomonadales bacterium]
MAILASATPARAVPGNYKKATAVGGFRIKDLTADQFVTMPSEIGHAYTLELDRGAWFSLDGMSGQYALDEVFGFWQIYDDPVKVGRSTTTGWDLHPGATAVNDIQGFRTPPKFGNSSKSLGLYQEDSPHGAFAYEGDMTGKSFSFLNTAPAHVLKKRPRGPGYDDLGVYDGPIHFGFHVSTSSSDPFGQVARGNGQKTGYIYLDLPVSPAVIPEPAFWQMAGLLGLGGLGALMARRRRLAA